MNKSKCFVIMLLLIGMAFSNLSAQSLNPNMQCHVINEGHVRPFDLYYSLFGATRVGVLIGNGFNLKNNDLLNISVGTDFALFRNLPESRKGVDFHLRSEYHFVPEKKWDWFGLVCATYSHGLNYTTSQYSEDIDHTPLPGNDVKRYSFWLQMGCGVQHHWSKHLSGVIEIVFREAIVSREIPASTTPNQPQSCLNINFGIRFN